MTPSHCRTELQLLRADGPVPPFSTAASKHQECPLHSHRLPDADTELLSSLFRQPLTVTSYACSPSQLPEGKDWNLQKPLLPTISASAHLHFSSFPPQILTALFRTG